MTVAADASADTVRVTHHDLANALRALAMDAVERAASGHPGMPMGMADIATVLFGRHLKFDPAAPDWPDRDRFVLSNGHGSMLLYGLLHLTGYAEMTLEELENFRQLDSRTPGHPEVEAAPGIETTTGPLGQGLANAVGMALAERLLNARFGDAVVDHRTYVFAGDGCLMEGISHEAVSLAGHLRLGRLIVLFDDNRISIDGATDLAVSDDQPARFAACGWHVTSCDGHDAEEIDAALRTAQADNRPSLIACRTMIGYGAPNKQNTSGVHGAPLGADEIKLAREALGWPHGPFVVPAAIAAAWRAFGARGAGARGDWRARHAAMDNETRQAFDRVIAGDLPPDLDDRLDAYKKALIDTPAKMATRQASGKALEVLLDAIPELIGGSADLTGSVNTRTGGLEAVSADGFGGRYIHYGVREHGMAAAMSGMALHGGVIPYGGTFLVFADYCRPAIRLAALMRQRVVFVMTHDSIGLGEDGPTHQPVEHLAMLRATPNLNVFRPADAVETAECWQLALASRETPSVLVLTRQGLAPVRTTHEADNLCARGAYVLAAAEHRRATILATGSEVEIALAARDKLAGDGIAATVVTMPCWELFDAQPQDYIASVLGTAPRVAVEAAATFGWSRYVADETAVVGMRSFGASAPAAALYEHFGITADAVVAAIRARL